LGTGNVGRFWRNHQKIITERMNAIDLT